MEIDSGLNGRKTLFLRKGVKKFPNEKGYEKEI